MPEVDPATGLPKEAVEKKSDIEKLSRLEVQRGRGEQLRDDLLSDKGQVVLNKIKEHLLNRINALVEKDGECSALKKLLVDMGITINFGEVAAERIMRLVAKKQAP